MSLVRTLYLHYCTYLPFPTILLATFIVDSHPVARTFVCYYSRSPQLSPAVNITIEDTTSPNCTTILCSLHAVRIKYSTVNAPIVAHAYFSRQDSADVFYFFSVDHTWAHVSADGSFKDFEHEREEITRESLVDVRGHIQSPKRTLLPRPSALWSSRRG